MNALARHIIMLLVLSFSLGTWGNECCDGDTLGVMVEDILQELPADTLDTHQTYSPQPRTIYDLPYSTTARMPDWYRLARNTTAFTLAGVATLYILETLPEDATAWNKKELRRMGLFERWRYHADKGPVWDKDNPIFNYVMHPYGGAVYYMSARSCGFNVLGSVAYSTIVSALLWEYGIECFNEIPSIQDLVITPAAGMVLGECFYRIKRVIVANNYHLCGSWLLGHLVAWLVDPINEFVGLISGNPCKQPRVSMSPTAGRSTGVGINLTLNF